MLPHTLVPLLTWRQLLSALVARRLDDEELAKPWAPEGSRILWLSRSTWSLWAVVRAREAFKPARPPVVWFPDFFCNAALTEVRTTSAQVCFYPITSELSPDYSACHRMAEGMPPDIFVVVHYFGRPANVIAAAEFCRGQKCWLVEDAAHVLLPTKGVGERCDFVLYSPHKHLPVPDGAVLALRTAGPGLGETAGAVWSQLSTIVDARRSSRRVASYIWLVKRIAQKMGLRRRAVAPFATDAMAPPTGPAAMSGLARCLLTQLIGKLPAIRATRMRHALLWKEVVGGTAISAVEASACPYLAGFAPAGGEIGERLYGRWGRLSWPVLTWPDLPPEVARDPAEHSAALRLRRGRIYLAVHQTLSFRDVVGREGVSPAPTGVQWEWFNGERSEWEKALTAAGRSSLLQSWAYGAAKSALEGWVPKRATITMNGKPIGAAQILIREKFSLGWVWRINRGPFFFGDTLTRGDVEEILRQLRRFARASRGVVLSVAPELELSGRSAFALQAAHFRVRAGVSPWTTIWLDLRPELAAIRASFAGKWRNALVSAEKSGLEVVASTDLKAFEWMCSRHREAMAQKGFASIAPELLLSLRAHSTGDDAPVVLKAMADNEAVGGICVGRHGVAATYVVGWNGPEGRARKANHLLLWHAVAWLRSRGYLWLDLGGIDEDKLPTVAAFKLGMNGDRVQLVGEYLAA